MTSVDASLETLDPDGVTLTEWHALTAPSTPSRAPHRPRPATTTARHAWRQRAACRGIDTDLFFTERGEDTGPAKAVCAGCPVRGECLDHALSNNERIGIWGGLAADERTQLRRAQRDGRRA